MSSRAVTVILTLILSFSLSHFMIPQVAAVEGDSWEVLAELPTARNVCGVAAVDGKIYVVGGLVGGGSVDVNEMYDPSTDSWVTKKPMPKAMNNFGIAVVQDKIYTIGGNVNQMYNPTTDTWENRTSMPTPRSAMCANVVDGKIYVIGGGGPLSPVDLNEVYDPAIDTWSTAAPIPHPVVDYASAVVDGKIYVIGGYCNLTQIYDPVTDTWSSGAPIPTELVNAAAGATSGELAPKRIYVFGGRPTTELDPFNRTYVYDPVEDSWTIGTPMPTSRSGHGVAVIDDRFYAIGGITMYRGPLTKQNERYTPSGYIPEYPTWVPLLLLLVVVTVTAVICNRRMKTLNRPV